MRGYLFQRLVKGAVHLLRHTGWGYRGVSQNMTHFDDREGGGGMPNHDI